VTDSPADPPPPVRGRCLWFREPQPYLPWLDRQEELARARLADRIPDTLILLQHRPVITLGRRGRREHLLADADTLAAHGIDLVQAPRGGDVTLHAPGQWVAYPIVRLRGSGAAHGHLHALEAAAVETARACGVEAFTRPGLTGAWCARGKLAAVGFKLTRGVTSHGLALNVRLDLAAFALIHGCGLVGEPVTSIAAALHPAPPPDFDAVGRRLAAALGRHLGVDWGEPECPPPA
jgi:lipoyl(octanoyl) transferase